MGIATGTAILGAAAIGAAGSYFGAQEARRGAQAQADAAEAAANAFRGVKIPTIEEQKIILQTPALMGQYTPEQIQAMQLGVSAMENVQADPEAVQQQKDALEGISQIAEGGYTEGDKAAAREINREVNNQNQARQKAILNAMAQRGVLGSGMELAAALSQQQDSSNQASRAADSLTQQAQARALQALGQQGAMASQLRSQSFGEQSDVARARDAINQFNLNNRQAAMNTNVTNRNSAQMYNLGQQQNIENQRAANANAQEQYNKGLIQTHYANQTGQAQQLANAEIAKGQAAANMANANAAMIQGIAGAGANALGGYATMMNANQQADKNRQNAMDIASVGAIKQPGKTYKMPASGNDDPFGNMV